MIRGNKSTSPKRKRKEFVLFGNVMEARIPEYNSMKDRHMQGYFKKKMIKTINKQIAPGWKIYKSNQNLEGVKPKEKIYKLPSLNKNYLKSKIAPVTSEQFKKVISKFRSKSNNLKQSISLASDRITEL